MSTKIPYTKILLPQFLILQSTILEKNTQNYSLESMQVLCLGVAHVTERSQPEVDGFPMFSGTLTINFPPLEIDRKTSCAPHGPVKFCHSRESTFPSS